MANPNPQRLYDKIYCKNTTQRATAIVILFFLVCLLGYRLLSLDDHGFSWRLAFICESWFTFTWVLVLSTKWSPVEYRCYPARLSKKVPELPPVDMFVTTADAVLEPPIVTANTVLSLLAVDYPAHKLACYLSDDACSPLTYYSLIETSKFAKLWVPFCQKYKVETRAPFRYFSTEPVPSSKDSLEFQLEWQKMKDEYEQLSRSIEEASKKPYPCELTGEFAVFSNVDRRDHPTIIKIIWENKDHLPDGFPHLVYISREKLPKHPHHYKAGAMNVLTRVSGLMTNAPFMLNVDCDMFANNPRIILHAMCLFFGSQNESEVAFVQCPQIFYDGLKDDLYGNQLVALHKYIGRGMVGIQGPLYAGTGCFHKRKIIYGAVPADVQVNDSSQFQLNSRLPDKEFAKTFGNSVELIKSASDALDGKTNRPSNDLSSCMKAAYQVARSSYEDGTGWGNKVGWMYGSASEDVLTGLMIHRKGWKSLYCSPKPPAFLGCCPMRGPAALTQQKRWATGLLEIFFSWNCPVLAIGGLQLRQCLAYMWILLWGMRSPFELCYAILPAYCIISNSHFLPKVDEPAMAMVLALLVIYGIHTLSEYIQTGLSIRAWWNNQRMARINATTAWIFGLLSLILKLLGLSEIRFEVTQKEQSSPSDDSESDADKFTFDDSPYFMLGTTILLVNLTAMLIGLLELPRRGKEAGVGEYIFSSLVVACFWPFFKGLFRKGSYGLPSSTICKSSAITLSFYCFSKWASRV